METNPFDPAAIEPETLAFNATLTAQLAALPGWSEPESAAGLREIHATRLRSHPPSTMARTRTIPGPAGELPMRVFVPERVRGVYLDIHGGGFVIGSAAANDAANERIAGDCEVAVVSLDYRLAPEHPYPAAPDDCEAAALWLVAHARSEFGAEPLLIGGISAGAQLAAVTLRRLRDRHGFAGWAGANLDSGGYSGGNSPSQRRMDKSTAVLSASLVSWMGAQYLPNGAEPGNPDLAPLYADLAGMPPALFTIGTLDPLLDDNMFMHARWRAAGNQAELAIYPGGVHGFSAMPLTLGRRASERMRAYIRTCLAAQAAEGVSQ